MYLKKKNYFLNLCNLMMMLGVFLGLNSMSWLMMWMSMEITLMFFIPNMILNKSMTESFSSLKYFIFQSLGSIFFIMGSMDFFFIFNTFGLIMKLGIFPNHYWMFSVSKGLSWKNFFFLMTIQKFLPLMFCIFSLKYIFYVYVLLMFFNSFIGNMGSLNQMDLRFLMVFSSMNHMTWMMMSSMMNLMWFYFYFFLYMILNLFLSINFNSLNIFYFYQLFINKNLNFNLNLMFISLIFFSFLGFPPLMGFFMKLIAMFSLTDFLFFMFMLMLLMQNLVISYSYMRLVIYLYLNLSRSTKMNKLNFKNYFLLFYLFLWMFLI